MWSEVYRQTGGLLQTHTTHRRTTPHNTVISHLWFHVLSSFLCRRCPLCLHLLSGPRRLRLVAPWRGAVVSGGGLRGRQKVQINAFREAALDTMTGNVPEEVPKAHCTTHVHTHTHTGNHEHVHACTHINTHAYNAYRHLWCPCLPWLAQSCALLLCPSPRPRPLDQQRPPCAQHAPPAQPTV